MDIVGIDWVDVNSDCESSDEEEDSSSDEEYEDSSKVCNRGSKCYERMTRALSIYQRLHGTPRVNASFIVPADAEWPKDLHHLKLGQQVANIRPKYRQNKLSRDTVSMLNDAGMVWERKKELAESTAQALRTYNELHGTALVPTHFVVPTGDLNWQTEFHGMTLGSSIANARYNAQTNKISDATSRLLRIAGMNWEGFSHDWKSKAQALRIYKQIHGTGWIPKNFVVPTDDPDWPEELGDLKLGQALSYARYSRKKLKSDLVKLLDDA